MGFADRYVFNIKKKKKRGQLQNLWFKQLEEWI